jgi:hypothetical protein
VQRLELVRIRVCQRCGRGGAELRSEGGECLVVPIDPARTREFTETNATDDVRSLTDLVLEQLEARGLVASEVVLDVFDGRLRALLSFTGGSDPDVVACTADEGLALAVHGEIKLYATEEAMEHASDRVRRQKVDDLLH